MPNLDEILKKTKKKSEQVKVIRTPPAIAIDDRPYSSSQSLNNTTKSSNKSTTNKQQSENKLTTEVAFSMLVGLQRDIIIFISNKCKRSHSRTTEALTLEYLAMSLKRSAGTIKTTLQRLEKKGCLVRMAFKNGRGGWSQYKLPDSIYHDVLKTKSGNKQITKWQHKSIIK